MSMKKFSDQLKVDSGPETSDAEDDGDIDISLLNQKNAPKPKGEEEFLTNTEKASFSVELRCLEEVCSPPVSLCLFDHNTFCLHRVNIALHDESLYV